MDCLQTSLTNLLTTQVLKYNLNNVPKNANEHTKETEIEIDDNNSIEAIIY